MRKLIVIGTLALAVIVASARGASAIPIPVGEVTWTWQACDTESPCLGNFSIVNQTGLNEQNGVFPVGPGQMDFSSIQLFVDGSLTAETLTDVFSDGYNFDSDLRGAWVSAVIKGAAPNGPFAVQGGGPFIGGNYLFSGDFFTMNSPFLYTDVDGLDANGAPIENGTESVLIYVEGTPVPEPVSMSLLGLGLAGVVARRRRAAKN